MVSWISPRVTHLFSDIFHANYHITSSNEKKDVFFFSNMKRKYLTI